MTNKTVLEGERERPRNTRCDLSTHPLPFVVEKTLADKRDRTPAVRARQRFLTGVSGQNALPLSQRVRSVQVNADQDGERGNIAEPSKRGGAQNILKGLLYRGRRTHEKSFMGISRRWCLFYQVLHPDACSRTYSRTRQEAGCGSP